jgi:D-alanyl-D-alanine carboxypeptidase/D-alanyl-D-alanine-endopeptidase (penicillin-binding protein 4)
VLTGSVPQGGEPVETAHAIAEPARMAAVALKDALARQGVEVHGGTRLGTAPTGARAIASHQSPMLGDLIHTMNKESDNLFAETMLFQLGIRGQGAPGTRDKGMRTLRSFLERLGWPGDGFRLEDGSGLSRYDAVTPGQLTALLCSMPSEALAYPAYLVSLPVAGVDGTLAARLADPAIRGRVRAKTGSMSSVSNLAGYLTTDSGRTVAVAIMVNGFVGPAARVRQMQDALVQAIAAGDADTSAQR